jgi:hypothetical protein
MKRSMLTILLVEPDRPFLGNRSVGQITLSECQPDGVFSIRKSGVFDRVMDATFSSPRYVAIEPPWALFADDPQRNVANTAGVTCQVTDFCHSMM